MNRTVPPEVKPLGRLVMPQQTVETLSNGITLHILGGGAQPVSRFKIVFSGGVDEFDNNCTPQLAIGSLPDGSASYPTGRLADLLDFNGVRIGPEVSLHNTVATVSVLNSRMAEVLPVLMDVLQNPSFPEEYIASDREMALADMRAQKTAVKATAMVAFRRLMRGKEHPTVRILEESQLDGFGHDAAADLYVRLMCPARMHVFMAGQTDGSLVDAVRAAFGSLRPLSGGTETSPVPYRPSEPCTERVTHAGTMQSAIVAGIPAVGIGHPDFPVLQLANMALGGYFGSRLMSNIREKSALTYGINSYLNGGADGTYMAISASCDHKYADRLIDEVNAELRRLVADPPRGEELRCLANCALAMYARQLDTPFSRMAYYMRQITDGVPDGYFDRKVDAALSITPEAIADVAARYFDPSRLITVVAGESASIN